MTKFSAEHRQKLSEALRGNSNAKRAETVTEKSVSFYSEHLDIVSKLIDAGVGDNVSQVVRVALEWAEERL